MSSYFEFNGKMEIHSKQVYTLSNRVLHELLDPAEVNISSLITATSCPDQLAPSLGQMLCSQYPTLLNGAHIIDLVQGCAGGVSAMILASQLAELNKESVLVVLADSARKSVSQSNGLHKGFGNGAFATLVCYEPDTDKRLIHHASRHYADLTNVVEIKLGHDAKFVIESNNENITKDPIGLLGLSFNNSLALKLLTKANSFYDDFVQQSQHHPDLLVFHQVNNRILSALKGKFGHKVSNIVDTTEITGNCGAASIGIALKMIESELENKRVMICGFGTGGTITAGLWQF